MRISDWSSDVCSSDLTAWAVSREEEGSAVPADDFDAREVAALIFAGHLDVNYSYGSYVMPLSFSSLDPERSAAIVNYIAGLHVQKQLQAKRNGARRAIAWMDKQLPVIQQDVLYAERRIAEFRSQHPLLATKSGSLTEAQLYGVNTALVQARAALGGKRAKLAIIRTIQSTGGDLDTMTDVIVSHLISALRDRKSTRMNSSS